MTATPTNKSLYNKLLEEGRRKFDVWPSAYGSAWLVNTYKKKGGTYTGSKGPVKKSKRKSPKKPKPKSVKKSKKSKRKSPKKSKGKPVKKSKRKSPKKSKGKPVQNIACVRARLLDVWLKKNA
jgi:hypothetical protein